MTDKPKRPRGFATMTPEKRREISQKGGKAAWRKGVAHSFESGAEANTAREKGLATRRKKAHS